MISFGIICYYIFREPVSFENREPVGELKHFPLFFGTVLFALEAIGVVSSNMHLKCNQLYIERNYQLRYFLLKTK